MDTPIKRCTQCGQEFPATSEYFYRDAHLSCGLMSACKKCRYEYQHRYRLENGDPVRAGEKRYRDTHPEKMRQKRERQSIELRETKRRWYEKNKSRMTEKNRQWRREHADIIRTNNRNRKAMLRNAPGEHHIEDVRDQYRRQKGKCYYCGKKVGDTYHVDHVIPLSRGGSNGPDNLVITCPDCNLSKRDRS